jgi:DNA-binding NtrC family response regulator
MQFLTANEWEGNVRELENVVIQGILYSKGDEIQVGDIKREPPSAFGRQTTLMEIDAPLMAMEYKSAKEETLKRFNASYIGNILAQHQGNVTRAARQCGLERQSLQQIMRRYQISANSFRSDKNG